MYKSGGKAREVGAGVARREHARSGLIGVFSCHVS